ncbi:MAG: hypothetical protein JWM05_1995, partial [Acidimicrobiales bacterium]|nr:hypothetical protein [Acidimicrobiales bacterium]
GGAGAGTGHAVGGAGGGAAGGGSNTGISGRGDPTEGAGGIGDAGGGSNEGRWAGSGVGPIAGIARVALGSPPGGAAVGI